MIDVNLIKDQRKKVIEEQSREQRRNKVGYSILIGSMVIFGVILLGRIGLGIRESGIDDKVLTAEAELKQYQQAEVDGVAVIRKIKDADRILQARVDVGRRLGIVFAIFGQGSELKSIEFGGLSTSEGMHISGSTQTVYDYISFTDRLIRLGYEQQFKSVEQASLNRGSDARYSFGYKIEPGVQKK